MKMKKGVILVNTSRGGLIDTSALIKGLDEDVFGGVGLDVYENVSCLFSYPIFTTFLFVFYRKLY